MKLRVQLQCKNLHEYLRELSPDVLDRLYNHPATCLAVFRELPPLAKNYVMRMLFLDQPLPQAAVALWVKKDSQKAHDECVSVLMGLRMWHSQQLQGGLQGLVLNPVFKDNLRVALLGGGKSWADEGSSLGPDRHPRDVESLDRYALERWEVILQFMVGSPSAAVSQDLAQLLIQAGLMRRGMDLVEILSFLFQLSFSTLGRRKSRRYYPTRLAITLAAGVNANSTPSSALGSSPGTGDSGFIVVETNYRVYAYTSVLYNQFLSQADFEVLRDRAQGLGVLVWQNAPHRMMVVTPHGHSEVKRFWKRQKSHT
ncbi:hypothetical protein JZ751_011436 [Albula glossodonta]|uniref:General transcription factor IIH subunit 4 n=1 Tax=Albula glossodonta TaxID=121402 RepID=A0A8T2MYX5_9TELE|nr:hypothetical protein JZ751_011436 [Albula glossodonta]